jgi:hypothetical protein
MPSIRESSPFDFDLPIYSVSYLYLMMRQWHIVSGMDVVDFNLSLQSLAATGGTTPGVSLRPALQYAAVRTDRPDAPFELAVGTADATAVGNFHFQETLVAATALQKFWVRGGIASKLTAVSGTPLAGRAMGAITMAHRSLGELLPADELVVGPYPASTSDKFVHPLGGGRPNLATHIAGVRFAMVGIGASSSGTITLQPMARFYNDPMARGDWTAIGTSVSPTGTDFAVAPAATEVTFAGFTTTDYQYFDLAMAVWKSATPSRLILRVNTALRYS